MKFNSPRQLKDWLRNKENSEGIPANTLINYYMMERLLERISASRFRDMFIIKGGFLISSMIGINNRSTMDLDSTLKGIKINETIVRTMMQEILSIDLDDQVVFQLIEIKSIHEISQYEDFRLTLKAHFFSMWTMLKVDLTTGDWIIPKEIDYDFKLMFEDRAISLKAYNLQTILAEKIESILSRNVLNTRARDYYDVFSLLSIKKSEIKYSELLDALAKKTQERQTQRYLDRYSEYLDQIQKSPELRQIWSAYQKQYDYAKAISFDEIITILEKTLNNMMSGQNTSQQIGS